MRCGLRLHVFRTLDTWPLWHKWEINLPLLWSSGFVCLCKKIMLEVFHEIVGINQLIILGHWGHNSEMCACGLMLHTPKWFRITVLCLNPLLCCIIWCVCYMFCGCLMYFAWPYKVLQVFGWKPLQVVVTSAAGATLYRMESLKFQFVPWVEVDDKMQNGEKYYVKKFR